MIGEKESGMLHLMDLFFLSSSISLNCDWSKGSVRLWIKKNRNQGFYGFITASLCLSVSVEAPCIFTKSGFERITGISITSLDYIRCQPIRWCLSLTLLNIQFRFGEYYSTKIYKRPPLIFTTSDEPLRKQRTSISLGERRFIFICAFLYQYI